MKPSDEERKEMTNSNKINRRVSLLPGAMLKTLLTTYIIYLIELDFFSFHLSSGGRNFSWLFALPLFPVLGLFFRHSTRMTKVKFWWTGKSLTDVSERKTSSRWGKFARENWFCFSDPPTLEWWTQSCSFYIFRWNTEREILINVVAGEQYGRRGKGKPENLTNVPETFFFSL